MTWKPWLTAGAAAYVAFPDCAAWITQVPAVFKVTVAPDTEQMAGEAEAKVTGRFEEAVALTVNTVPTGWSDNGANVVVWLNCVI